jgi:hypothetical protein
VRVLSKKLSFFLFKKQVPVLKVPGNKKLSAADQPMSIKEDVICRGSS